MDYIVTDSTLYKNGEAYDAIDNRDTAIRVGIVRKSIEVEKVGTKYLVECFVGGNQVPVSCVPLTRFNSPYNFEEIRLKPWLRGSATSGFLDPGTASTYSLRDGETVMVAFIDGSAREGVILGSIKHPTRDTVTDEQTLAYHSVYNGLETTIDTEGAYKVTFKGAPLNDQKQVQPGTQEPSAVEYNDEIAGSFYSFDNAGNFSIDCSNNDGANSVVINKTEGMITIESGKSTINIVGGSSDGELSITTGTINTEAKEVNYKAQSTFKVEAAESISIKALNVAIGNDTIELVDGILQMIDALGKVVVTSPVGTCTPLMASPQWASGVIPLITKLNTLKGSL